MKDFEVFLHEGGVKRITPDKLLIQSLFTDAMNRMDFYKKLELNKDTAKFILENIYDSLRELADAILIKDGYKSYSHEASIVYLSKYKFSASDLNLFDRIRKIRNNSKYYGKHVDVEDAKSAIELLEKLLNNIKDILKL